jgi:hypothetical protein
MLYLNMCVVNPPQEQLLKIFEDLKICLRSVRDRSLGEQHVDCKLIKLPFY